MIALPHHLPFVRVGKNNLTLCQNEWLQQLIADAAADTDVPQWLAIDIAKGILKYLQEFYQGTVIDSEELFSKISSTLNQLGLTDLAANIDKSPPPLRISLTDLARRAGESYELAFFQLLEDKCQDAIESGASCVECHGLEKCVITLQGQRSWTISSDALTERIEKKIDEFRALGELTNPVFNVSVAQ